MHPVPNVPFGTAFWDGMWAALRCSYRYYAQLFAHITPFDLISYLQYQGSIPLTNSITILFSRPRFTLVTIVSLAFASQLSLTPGLGSPPHLLLPFTKPHSIC